MQYATFRSLRSAGFSLVEILLVIVIILMLAGALVVFVLPQQKGAQRTTTRIKLEQIETALQLYRTNIGTYPGEGQGGLVALKRKPNYENEKLAQRWAGPYLTRGATLDDAWGNTLQYELVDRSLTTSTSGPDYRLFSLGPDGQPETDDDIKLYEVDAMGDEGELEEVLDTGGNSPVTPPARITPASPGPGNE